MGELILPNIFMNKYWKFAQSAENNINYWRIGKIKISRKPLDEDQWKIIWLYISKKPILLFYQSHRFISNIIFAFFAFVLLFIMLNVLFVIYLIIVKGYRIYPSTYSPSRLLLSFVKMEMKDNVYPSEIAGEWKIELPHTFLFNLPAEYKGWQETRLFLYSDYRCILEKPPLYMRYIPGEIKKHTVYKGTWNPACGVTKINQKFIMLEVDVTAYDNDNIFSGNGLHIEMIMSKKSFAGKNKYRLLSIETSPIRYGTIWKRVVNKIESVD
jgi:hypothetical protein